MLKNFKGLAAVLFAGLLFSACSKDTTEMPTSSLNTQNEALIINQGSVYNKIYGTLASYNTTTHLYTDSLFYKANQIHLGDNPQYGVATKKHIFIAEYNGNHVWKLNRQTLQVEAEIKSSQPEDVAVLDDQLYIAENDGFVRRVNINNLSDSTRAYVGPNPSNLLVANHSVYVSISDGFNYSNNYPNGKKVVVLDPKNIKKQKQYNVGLNPGKLVNDNLGNVFVMCRGNYQGANGFTAVSPSIWKISKDGAKEFIKGENMACHQTDLYVISSKPLAETTQYQIDIYNSTDGTLKRANILEPKDAPIEPIYMAFSPNKAQLFITSNSKLWGYSDPGQLYIYDTYGKLIKKIQTGVNPYGVIFLR